MDNIPISGAPQGPVVHVSETGLCCLLQTYNTGVPLMVYYDTCQVLSNSARILLRPQILCNFGVSGSSNISSSQSLLRPTTSPISIINRLYHIWPAMQNKECAQAPLYQSQMIAHKQPHSPHETQALIPWIDKICNLRNVLGLMAGNCNDKFCSFIDRILHGI